MHSNLRKYRLKAGLSQQTLAQLVGFSDGQRRISHYETGRRKADLDDCRALVKALNKAGVICCLDEVFPPPEASPYYLESLNSE